MTNRRNPVKPGRPSVKYAVLFRTSRTSVARPIRLANQQREDKVRHQQTADEKANYGNQRRQLQMRQT